MNFAVQVLFIRNLCLIREILSINICRKKEKDFFIFLLQKSYKLSRFSVYILIPKSISLSLHERDNNINNECFHKIVKRNVNCQKLCESRWHRRGIKYFFIVVRYIFHNNIIKYFKVEEVSNEVSTIFLMILLLDN